MHIVVCDDTKEENPCWQEILVAETIYANLTNYAKKKNYKINRIIDLNLRDFDYNIYLLHFYLKNLENKVIKKKKVYSKKKKKTLDTILYAWKFKNHLNL